MNVLILGASRGIGLELVRQYRADGHRVVASARSDNALAELTAMGAHALRLDVADTASCAGLAWQIDGEAFDAAWLVAGVFGPRKNVMEPPTANEFDEVMHTNVLAAMRLLPQVADHLAPAAKLAVVSSRMGSMGLRTNTSGWLYRASKAALNSVLKDVALSLDGRAACVSFHPGWVRTDMGGAEADIDVTQSAGDMRRTLSELTPKDNGGFFNHDGQPLAW